MKRLYYFGAIEEERIGRLYAEIDQATQPILLTICSDGGEMFSASALAYCIRNAKVHVHTYGTGNVDSAALDILAAGHTRGLHPNTICMTHTSSGHVNETIKKMSHKNELALYAHIPNVLANYGKIFTTKKKFWNADEMRQFGFVHYVAQTPLTNAFHGEEEASSVHKLHGEVSSTHVPDTSSDQAE